MITKEVKELMEKQQYRIVGSHSAVKVCGWAKKMIRGEGGCYKLKFYGIRSNQCLQMSTSLSCANRCIFCWRDYKAPVSKEWIGEINDPQEIIDGAKEAQKELLSGFGGHPSTIKELKDESKTVKHVALSLTGEAINYPKINEIIELFHKEKISTFLVTNGQYPEEIKNLPRITQLYISLDAPNKEILKKVSQPLFTDHWERLNKSLEYLSQKKERTCLRFTLMREINMCDLEGYSKLIKKGDPDFLEIKSYMFVGSSRQRLDLKNMPFHEDMVNFSKALVKYLPDYEIVAEHIPSRIVLLAKKKYKQDGKWHTWIDFDKFFNKEEDYSRETPDTGISGKGTKDRMKVDEKTDELEFWQED